MEDIRKCTVCGNYYNAMHEHYNMVIEKEELGYCRSSLRYDVCPSCANVILSTISSIRHLNKPRPDDDGTSRIRKLLNLL